MVCNVWLDTLVRFPRKPDRQSLCVRKQLNLRINRVIPRVRPTMIDPSAQRTQVDKQTNLIHLITNPMAYVNEPYILPQ